MKWTLLVMSLKAVKNINNKWIHVPSSKVKSLCRGERIKNPWLGKMYMYIFIRWQTSSHMKSFSETLDFWRWQTDWNWVIYECNLVFLRNRIKLSVDVYSFIYNIRTLIDNRSHSSRNVHLEYSADIKTC